MVKEFRSLGASRHWELDGLKTVMKTVFLNHLRNNYFNSQSTFDSIRNWQSCYHQPKIPRSGSLRAEVVRSETIQLIALLTPDTPTRFCSAAKDILATNPRLPNCFIAAIYKRKKHRWRFTYSEKLPGLFRQYT